jgi:hypothetical protein
MTESLKVKRHALADCRGLWTHPTQNLISPCANTTLGMAKQPYIISVAFTASLTDNQHSALASGAQTTPLIPPRIR